MTDTKRCGRCKAEKPVTEFYRSKATKSGFCCECKVCSYQKKLKSLAVGDRKEKQSEHYKQWYQANREVLLQKKRERRKDPAEKEKDKVHSANRRARMGEEAWAAWRKKTRNKEMAKAYNKIRAEMYLDAEVRAEIRSQCKFTKLANEDIPQEMIEVYRLLRFINRRIKNEECNSITK